MFGLRASEESKHAGDDVQDGENGDPAVLRHAGKARQPRSKGDAQVSSEKWIDTSQELHPSRLRDILCNVTGSSTFS